MDKNILEILEYSIILKAKSGKCYRNLKIKDLSNKKEIDHIIWENRNPNLWADFIKVDSNGKNPQLYNGRIDFFCGLDIVIFGYQTPEQAFEGQKWKLEKIQSVTWAQAKEMMKLSEGYKCDYHTEDNYTVGWLKPENKPKKIKFRYYKGREGFSWGEWIAVK